MANPRTILSADTIYVDLKGEKNIHKLNQELNLKKSNEPETLDALRCPICLDIFEEPKILPCGHSYCHECIEKLRKSDGIQSASGVCCPLCRDASPMPTGGYKTNYAAQNAISSLEKRKALTFDCCNCDKSVISKNEIVQCKSCQNVKEKRILVCMPCAIKRHNGHDLIHCSVPSARERLKTAKKISLSLNGSFDSLSERLANSKNLLNKYFQWLDSIISQLKIESKNIEKKFLSYDEILLENDITDGVCLSQKLSFSIDEVSSEMQHFEDDIFSKIKYFDHILQSTFRSTLNNHESSSGLDSKLI